jgi:hypothetical protein
MIAFAAALVAVPLAACGPSGKQVATAREARYQGEQQQLFAVIKQTVAASYTIQKVDDASYGLQTEGRWFSPEGQAISTPMGDARDKPDGSLSIALVVQLQPDGDRYIVLVKPIVARFIKGQPAPQPLEENDPSVPSWVRDKGDNLQVSLHEALKQYEVKGAGGAAPAAGGAAPGPSPTPPPTTAPVPDPVGPTSTPPPPAP